MFSTDIADVIMLLCSVIETISETISFASLLTKIAAIFGVYLESDLVIFYNFSIYIELITLFN